MAVRASIFVVLAACGRIGFDDVVPSTSVRASISAAPGVTVSELDARFAFASLDPDELHGITPALPTIVVFPLPDASGPLTMTVGAVDVLGRELSAAGTTDVISGGEATVTIVIGADLTPSCSDGKTDGGETDADCGGGCPACGVGGSCVNDSDCVTANCIGTSCEPVSGPPVWQSIHDMPIGRIGPGAALGTDGLLYVYGGAANDLAVPTSEVDLYDSTTDSWTAAPPLLEASFRMGHVSAGGAVYAVGGNNTDVIANVESLTPGATQWVGQTPLPTGRLDLVAAVDATGTIYAMGGDDNVTVLGDVYALVGNAWQPRTAMPTPRSNLGVAITSDGTFLAIGGHNGVGTIHYTTVEGYDPVHDTWQTYPSLNHMRSDFGAAAAPDGRAYAVSGYDGAGILTSVEAYRPGASVWVDVTPVSTARDTNVVAIGRDGRVLVIGGKNGPSLGYASVEAYGPVLAVGSTSGMVGDAVTVSGSSFGASANVRVYFDSTPVELATTDASGAFGPVTIHVPAVLPPGSHVVRAIDDRAGYPVTQPFSILVQQ